MTVPVIFAREARLELIEAQDWYEGKSGGLGAVFRREVVRVVDRLRESPLQFPVVQLDVRRARLLRFPYALYFRPGPRSIEVIACFHSRRDGRAWQGRR